MNGEDYRNGDVHLLSDVREPSYAQCMAWMKAHPTDAPPTFDFWARGNFTRRLIRNRQENRAPLNVAVTSVPQARWAYRRLALLGAPIDFIYSGPVSKPLRLLHMLPLEDDTVFDCGWGYLGTISEVGQQHVLTLIGTARLMPQELFDWLMRDVSSQFVRGEVFIAPSQLIGLGSTVEPKLLDALSLVSTGCSFHDPAYGAAAALMSLDLPFVDGMSSEDFDLFLQDSSADLASFRAAFGELTASHRAVVSSVDDILRRLRHEVAEITRAARFQRMRNLIARCKGRVATFETFVGVLGAIGAVVAHDPFAGTAALAGAGKALRDIWTQAKTTVPELSRHPMRLLWTLGASGHPRKFRTSYKWTLRQSKTAGFTRVDPYHWLCPPTPGISFLVVNKEKP